MRVTNSEAAIAKEIQAVQNRLNTINWYDGIRTVDEIKIIYNLLIKYEMLTGKEYEIKSMEDSII